MPDRRLNDLTFDDLIDRLEQEDSMNSLERSRVRSGIMKLKEVLGNQFSSDLANDHPIHMHFLNRAPWELYWFSWLGNALHALRSSENFNSLINRIHNKNKFSEAVSVIEVAHRFVKSGLSVDTDPEIKISGRDKAPDLLVRNVEAGDLFYTEVSELQMSQSEQRVQQQMDVLAREVLMPQANIIYSGNFIRSVSHAHFEQIKNRINKACEEADVYNELVEVIEDDVVEFAVAPEHESHALRLWCDQKGLEMRQLIMPSIEVDEIHRLANKINGKVDQLPDNHANTLVIKCTRVVNQKNLEELCRKVEEIVFDQPKLALLVLSGRLTGQTEAERVAIRHNRYSKSSWIPLHMDVFLTVPNRFCKTRIAPATLTRELEAFT